MNLSRDKSGQALLEFAFVLPMLCVFLLGVVDYGRAIYQSEVIMNLAGEGSSLASRSSSGNIATNLQNAANIVMMDADLPMTTSGCVVITAVQATNTNGTWSYSIAAQQEPSSPTCGISPSSRVGCGPKSSSCNGVAMVPAGVQTALQNEPTGSYAYVTEVFFKFTYATPVGYFLGGTGALPTDLYTVAYF